MYTEEEYNSGDGMLTTVWGPSMWHFLHTMSFNYPSEPTKNQKIYYKKFMESLIHVLPCKYCRINLIKNYKKLPLKMEDMKSRYTFSKYVYKLHEHINKMLNKKSGLTYEDVRERYEHFRARCTVNEPVKEKGCTEPLVGKKSKGIIQIIPKDTPCESIQIDQQCLKQKV